MELESVNLKNSPEFLEQYVSLRNSYTELLLTKTVTVLETHQWLRDANVEIYGIVKGSELVGTVILYLDKSGEVAFFVKEKGKGYGSKLLFVIENVAKTCGLDSVWAWVLDSNKLAQRAFEKNDYHKEAQSQKTYNTKSFNGIIFRKVLFPKVPDLTNHSHPLRQKDKPRIPPVVPINPNAYQ